MLYYLQSRYYNPEWGRFINADGIVGATGELLGHNMFAYCKNNVINGSDPSGFSVKFATEEEQEEYDQWVQTQKPVASAASSSGSTSYSSDRFEETYKEAVKAGEEASENKIVQDANLVGIAVALAYTFQSPGLGATVGGTEAGAEGFGVSMEGSYDEVQYESSQALRKAIEEGISNVWDSTTSFFIDGFHALENYQQPDVPDIVKYGK